MELNRNQWFFLGLVILLIGIQLRMVSEFVLNEEATRFLAERMNSVSDRAALQLSSDLGGSQKVLRLPEWSGWCLISVGSVLILHSLAMRRPG